MAWAQDIIRCQYCEEEPALFHCVPCGDELCPRCKNFHLKSKVPSGHNVVPISERLHPTNVVEMCESHSSKPYDACCEDCQVPVCILCIQEIHNTHRIGKMQDMYEKQKAEAMKELSEMKTQKRADVIKKIKDVENGESRMKTSHQNLRREMKRQAKDFTDHITAILNEGLGGSESDEKKKLEELSQHKTELEEYQQKLEHVIEKLENLTESRPPANFILYRKQNPDVVKQLKFPDTLVTTDPTFTPGQLDKIQNEKQFGQLTKIQLMRVMTDDRTQCAQLTRRKQKKRKAKMQASANSTLLSKMILQRPVKLSHLKLDKKVLRHVACVSDERAYISEACSGILLIERPRPHLDTINTSGHPSAMAVMKDGSLIYSVDNDSAIYQVLPNKQTTKLVNISGDVTGLCCTRSGEILVTLLSKIVPCYFVEITKITVARYSGSGEMIHQFIIFNETLTWEYTPIGVWPICENVNGDICIAYTYPFSGGKRVEVYDKSGEFRFYYNGQGETRKFDSFHLLGLATDSLGHIIISGSYNHVVHLISQDGDFIAYILTEDDGIADPWGVAVDQSDNLWLTERDNVKVYQYLTKN